MNRKRRWIGIALMLMAGCLLAAVPAWAQEPVKIDINSADKTQLMTLDGIGQAYADRIIAYREANGPFASLEDITSVRGIGPKTLERNRDRIVANPLVKIGVEPQTKPQQAGPRQGQSQ